MLSAGSVTFPKPNKIKINQNIRPFFDFLLKQLGNSEELGIQVFVVKKSEQLAMRMIQKICFLIGLRKKLSR
jgi:hypothetical protein